MTSTTEKYLFRMCCKQDFNKGILNTINNAANVNCTDSKGWTPLMYAISHGRTKTIEALLAAGADPTITVGDTSALKMIMDIKPSASLVKAFLDASPKPLLPDNNGQTLLMRAISKGCSVEIAKLLVSEGVDIEALDNVDKYGNQDNALSEALQKYNYELVEYLLSIGCKPMIKTTLLVYIDIHSLKFQPILVLLLHYGYVLNNDETHVNMSKNPMSLKKMALIYGTSVDTRNLYHDDKKNKTKDYGNMLKSFYEKRTIEEDPSCEKACLLLSTGLQIFRETDTEKNAIHMIAARTYKYDLIYQEDLWIENFLYTQVLLTMGADPNFEPKYGVPRFAKICKYKKDLPVKYLEIFLKQKVDLNYQYKPGVTVLEKLISQDHPKVHQYLLDHDLVKRENIHGLALTFLNHYSELVEKLQQQLLYQMKPGDLAASLLQEEFPNVKKFDLFK